MELIDRRGVAGWIAAAAALSLATRGQQGAAAELDTRDAPQVALDDLLAANHILATEGVIDAFGHVSCRHPVRTTHFVMSRARAPGLVVADDLMEFDADGTPIDPAGRKPYVERFIHAAIYAARPDIHSVVHDHSAEIIPFGISSTPLRPVSHTGGLIGESVPVWDIREVVGETSNLLVTTLDIGKNLARRLGGGYALLMRGHGAVAAGTSIRVAVHIAISLNTQARLLSEALALGRVTYLSKGEVAATAKTFSPETPGDAVGRTWEYWCVRAGVPFHARGA